MQMQITSTSKHFFLPQRTAERNVTLLHTYPHTSLHLKATLTSLAAALSWCRRSRQNPTSARSFAEPECWGSCCQAGMGAGAQPASTAALHASTLALMGALAGCSYLWHAVLSEWMVRLDQGSDVIEDAQEGTQAHDCRCWGDLLLSQPPQLRNMRPHLR